MGSSVLVYTPFEAGLHLQDLRKRAGLTQQQLADRAMVSRRWLVNFESGRSTVEVGKVMDCFNALGRVFAVVDEDGGDE